MSAVTFEKKPLDARFHGDSIVAMIEDEDGTLFMARLRVPGKGPSIPLPASPFDGLPVEGILRIIRVNKNQNKPIPKIKKKIGHEIEISICN